LFPQVAFFFGQVTMSGEKCRHSTPGHVRYLRVLTKKSARSKTRVFKLTVPSPTVKKPPNGLSCHGLINNNNKKKIIVCYWFFSGNIGGLFGLFLGCSIISFFEILYFFVIRLYFDRRNRRKAKSKITPSFIIES